MPGERVARLTDIDAAECPYFAIVLVHGKVGVRTPPNDGHADHCRPRPGSDALVTPEVLPALAAATDILGYAPYVSRVPPRTGLKLHPSDNREELQRASEALRLAAEGGRVVVVSSGDPGVFAMASAVFEALEQAPQYGSCRSACCPLVTRCWQRPQGRGRSAMIFARLTSPTI